LAQESWKIIEENRRIQFADPIAQKNQKIFMESDLPPHPVNEN